MPHTALLRHLSPLLIPTIATLLLCSQAANATTITIGTGSGMLDYPTAQQTLNLNPGDTLIIAPGTYTGLSLQNLSGTAAAPIAVKCDPKTLFTNPRAGGDNTFANLSFIHFENFHINDGATWLITGASHDLLFKNFIITNARAWSFRPYDAAKIFDGTKESAFYNFKWENCAFGSDDGKMYGPAISNTDWQPVSAMKSLLLDFEVSHCTFKNFDFGRGPGAVLGMDRCFNLTVHDCSFSDIGVSKMVIGHDVVIGGSGYYKIYNNTFTRQWANNVRMFPVKLNALGYNGKDAVTRYYNNISYEKRKYPDFEQNRVRDEDLAQSKFLSRTGSEIYFNTLYRSRKGTMTSDPYIGPLVDIYAPDVTIKYNLVIDPECDTPFDPERNYIYQFGAGPQPGIVWEGNLTFKTLEEAGLIDAIHFTPSKTSPAADAATGRIDFITQDHDGNERYIGQAADVGAIERPHETAPTEIPKPAWASDFGKDQFGVWADLTINGQTQRMRYIPPGAFNMGSPKNEPDRDPDESQHQVTLTRGYWLAATELTQAFYQAVIPDHKIRKGDNQLPLTAVSWDQTRNFFARLNELKPALAATLPTEAQWEYACRAATTTPTPAALDAIAWYAGNSTDAYHNYLIHPVAQKQPNAWGLYDMLGNVWELCGDYYAPYSAAEATDPTGPPTGHMRIERGGGYNSAAPACRSAWRWGSESKSARNNLGFRLAAPSAQP